MKMPKSPAVEGGSPLIRDEFCITIASKPRKDVHTRRNRAGL